MKGYFESSTPFRWGREVRAVGVVFGTPEAEIERFEICGAVPWPARTWPARTWAPPDSYAAPGQALLVPLGPASPAG